MDINDNIFNRKREMESLSNVLMSSPKISIIAGPVHSGKTRLMNGVIMDLSKKTQQPMQVHSLNLQEKSIDSVVFKFSH